MMKLYYQKEILSYVKEKALDTITMIVGQYYPQKDTERTVGMVDGICRLVAIIEDSVKRELAEEENHDSGT